MISYLLSLLFSLSAMVMAIVLALSEFVYDHEFKFFGTKETLIVLGVSFIFLVIGWRSDTHAS